MDTRILNLMDSPNPEDRKKAVKYLAQDGSDEALRYLAVLYKSDDDEEVRDLAIKAGKYIKKQQIAAKWEGRPAQPDPEPEEEPELYQVSGADQERSRGLMEAAMNLATARKPDPALVNVKKAFKLNPNLQYDAYYMNMAMDIAGKNKEDTLALLLGEEKSREPVAYETMGGDEQVKRKRKNTENRDLQDITWGDALMDVGIYFLIMAACVIVGSVIVLRLGEDGIKSVFDGVNRMNNTLLAAGYGTPPEEGSITPLELEVLANNIVRSGLVFAIISGLVYAGISVIALFIQTFIYHITATSFLGGDGNWSMLVKRYANYSSIITVVTAIGLVIFCIQFIGAATSYYELMGSLNADQIVALQYSRGNLSDISSILTPAQFILYVEVSNTINILPQIAIGIFGLGGFIFSVWGFIIVGNVYRFGGAKGCLTTFIGNIVLGFISSICSSTIGSALLRAALRTIIAKDMAN